MAKRKEALVEEGSLGYYALQGMKKIRALAESGLISDKLLGINAITFVLVLTLAFSHWMLNNNSPFSISGVVIIAFSLIVSLAASLLYTPVIELLSKLAKDKVATLRQAIALEVVALPFAAYGVMQASPLAIKIGFGILALQVVIFLVGALIDFTPGIAQDRIVPAFDIKESLNLFGSIASIISLIITLFLLFKGG